MIFQEHKLETGFRYSVEAAAGKVDIRTAQKLTAHQIEKISAVIFSPSDARSTSPSVEPKPALKKGQCPNCFEFGATPLSTFIPAVGFAGVVGSIIACIIFLPIGILGLIASFGAMLLGPFIGWIFYPKHVYCLKCHTASELPTTTSE